MARRAHRATRTVSLVCGLAAWLLSSTPAAAGFIYCIGDGHSGFELVFGAGTSCERCCGGEAAEASDHAAGCEDEDGQCVDVAVSAAAQILAKHHEGSLGDSAGLPLHVAVVRHQASPGIVSTSLASTHRPAPPRPCSRCSVVLQL